MAREAKRRRFAEAPAKAFLGDGLAWNWSIWKQHFPDFTPILDFLHVLELSVPGRQGRPRRGQRRVGPGPGLDARLLARGGGAGPRGMARLADRRGEPPEGAAENDPRTLLAEDDHLSGEQPGSDEVPGVPPRGSAGDDGLEGVAGQGDELSGQGDGDVLERPGGSRGAPAGAGRSPL